MFNKILSFYTKYFAIWVIVFGIIAYFFPGPFKACKPAMPWFFALTMFGIGAVLKIDDFKRILAHPSIVLIGCIAQFTIMPIGAFVLARIFGLSPVLSVGLILAGCAPGAMASNVMSYIAKADTAYSVSLTTVSTLLCPILTPVLTYLLAGSKLDVPVLNMFIFLVMTVVAPIFIGFSVRHFFDRQVEKIDKIFPAISVTFIIFICSVVIAANQQRLEHIKIIILTVTVLLNVYGMLAGFSVGSFFKMDTRRRRTLSIEIGMQNAGLGTTLAIKYLSEESAIPTAAFVFVCIITASIMSEIWQRQKNL